MTVPRTRWYSHLILCGTRRLIAVDQSYFASGNESYIYVCRVTGVSLILCQVDRTTFERYKVPFPSIA